MGYGGGGNNTRAFVWAAEPMIFFFFGVSARRVLAFFLKRDLSKVMYTFFFIRST